MTWGLIISLVLVFFIKILLSCPPKRWVKWSLDKFELHPKLLITDVTVTYDGRLLKDEEKQHFISEFNNGNFLKRYNIFPGYEEGYLHPENNNTPFIIETAKARIMVYRYVDHVDVIKQFKKKVIAYSLHADGLQIS
ncbi:YfmQ family protein [Pullulanibacillus pueri]|uniref:Uncharacterized protein n=1 Tax=Pullulanibacillus pueri TaxID=1437324 RepID=A0A8J2ZXR4_9BACL|nr:YfmQ family protein [Pullulanibacillus pueri]GGH84269.1 hypothetical protein GCM10007096_26950 [Pullulanibacillus pueri]